MSTLPPSASLSSYAIGSRALHNWAKTENLTLTDKRQAARNQVGGRTSGGRVAERVYPVSVTISVCIPGSVSGGGWWRARGGAAARAPAPALCWWAPRWWSCWATGSTRGAQAGWCPPGPPRPHWPTGLAAAELE